ncbi:alpha/beta hydrolase [Nonomuraea sp. NPDC049709]|uniref:alpha/beta hydrolase n=1 Tax=Nonomuraea sp. NPDC049709 TaxID=3154736 RepID=UPI00342B663D
MIQGTAALTAAVTATTVPPPPATSAATAPRAVNAATSAAWAALSPHAVASGAAAAAPGVARRDTESSGPGSLVPGGPGGTASDGPGSLVPGGLGGAVSGGPGSLVPGGLGGTAADGPGSMAPGGPGGAESGGPGSFVSGGTGPGWTAPGGLGPVGPGGSGPLLSGGPGRTAPGGPGSEVSRGSGRMTGGAGMAGADVAGADVAGAGGAGKARRQVAWWDCGDGLRCGKLSVPVDWARPRGPRTEIDLAWMPAHDPTRNLGALVVNTGDESAVQAVRARPDTVSELARWFDVVLVEPRGIGDRGSTSMVRCSVPPPDPRRLQITPGPAAWRAYARDNAAYDRSCRIAAGPAYAGLTSWQVAHDLDALRAALGQPRLRYFGNAYGAVYGQAYLELFPRRVERMYLEGVPDHTEPGLGRRLIARARAAERQLTAFRDWCATRMGCPLDDDDAVSVLDDLLERAPLPAGPGRSLDARLITAAVLAGLAPQRWPELASAMSAAEEGDASALARMAAVAQPVGPGTVARSMACHDFMPAAPGYRRFLAMESRLRELAPRVGWLTGRYEVARCVGLRGRPSWPPRPFRPARAGKGPSVLVGIGRLDTDSPASGAARVAARIPGAAMLWHGDGHGAYLMQGVSKLRATCLRTRVHDYLVNGVLPRPRTVCPGELTAGMGS